MQLIHRKSAFINKNDFSSIKRERRYEAILGLTLFITGIIMLMIPIVDLNGILILADSWIMILAIALIAFRPILFGRGIADLSMTIIWIVAFFILEFSFSFAFQSIENFKIIISFIFLILGVTRIITFAQLMNRIFLPLLIVEGVSEIISSALVFSCWPTGNYATIYLAIGMTIVISSSQDLQFALKLRCAI